MKFRRRKRQFYVTIVFLVLVFLSIGYAYLSSTLSIRGNTKVLKNTWDIHFENVVIQGDSTITTQPVINNAKNDVSFSVVLAKPGDTYHFTVDSKNAGTLDAMISTFSNSALTENQKKYLDYTVIYKNGEAISQYDKLSAGKSHTIEVFLKYKDDISAGDLANSVDDLLNLSFTVTYVQADSNAKDVISKAFANDSWDTIVENIRKGKLDNYQVGATKEIDMGSFGKHTVRIANMSTPAECNSLPSQTACGFVVEFADTITSYHMNSATTSYPNGPNIGGWPASEMRTYIGNTIFSALPTELQNKIIDTTVVSSHGNYDYDNFLSTDKLYLLSTTEVWGTSSEIVDDSANYTTRQLDYYKSIGVTTSNTLGASKETGEGYGTKWWLRSAFATTNDSFYIVYPGGSWDWSIASNTYYTVSPAFRIG